MNEKLSNEMGNGRRVSRIRWSSAAVRAVVYQCAALGAIALIAWFLVTNTINNLAAHNIASGFGFLDKQAGFEIGESWLPYSPLDSYAYAILIGLSNTMRVSVIGIVLATGIGMVVGIARISGNYLVSHLAAAFVELLRNIPLLIQLFFWYVLITQVLPGPKAAHLLFPGVHLSNRGLTFPTLVGMSATPTLIALAMAAVICVAMCVWRRRTKHSGERATPVWPYALSLLVGLPWATFVLTGRDVSLNTPVLSGLNFTGGAVISPEFTALMVGLVVYTSAYIAEIVRAGIQSIPEGQWEAARSLGLGRMQQMRLIILPQARRVMIPPLASQFLNLVKNSSLAVAIGYPDLVAVVDTVLNQTGQAIESILIVMLAYLTVSLSISIFMNWYNHRVAMTER